MPSSGYRIVRLANGVHSVHSLAHGETFHPVVGPVAEAEALYVKQLRLGERLRRHQGEFVVWDVGLGAAANALTLLRAARAFPCSIRLISFDQTVEPLEFALKNADTLGYLGGYEPHVRMLAERHDVVFQNTRQSVHWTLCQGDFPALLADFVKRAARSAPPSPRRQVPPPAGYQQHEETHSPTPPPPHAILFDPFSPAKNPAMWTLTLFTNLFRRLDPGCPCALPTYSRSTMLRVTLLLAGFYVGAGEATGEKEETTLAANTLDLIEAPLDRKWLGRVRRSSSAEPLHEPVYRQARLAPGSWERLQAHPQFG